MSVFSSTVSRLAARTAARYAPTAWLLGLVERAAGAQDEAAAFALLDGIVKSAAVRACTGGATDALAYVKRTVARWIHDGRQRSGGQAAQRDEHLQKWLAAR